MYEQFSVAVVIPAFNEAALVARTVRSIPSFVDQVYVIDDGSTDSTAAEARNALGEMRRNENVVTHEKNSGVGAAIKTGYKAAIEAGADIIVVMAGDNQMDPKHLPKLLDPLIEGKADYAKGNRLYWRGAFANMSKWRILGNGILTMLTKISSGNWHISDPQNGYTAVTKEALERIGIDSIFHWYGYCNDMLCRMNTYSLRVVDVPIPAVYGQEKSGIRYGPYIFRVSRLLWRNFWWRMKVKYIARDFHPLILFYLMGITLTLFSLGATGWSLWFKLSGQGALFQPLVTSLVGFAIGTQFIFFAMYFDMMETRQETTR